MKLSAAPLKLLFLSFLFSVLSCSTEDVSETPPVAENPVEILDVAFAEYMIFKNTPGVYSETNAGTTRYYLNPAVVTAVEELVLSKTAANITDLQNGGVASAEVKITSLDGIQYFTGLKRLVLTSNSLQTLDVSSNTQLEELELNFNLIGSLNLTNNPALTRLRYRGSATATPAQKITTIDLSGNPLLRHLYLINHSIVTINLSNNPLIDDTLDLSGNPGPDGNPATGDIVVPAAIYNQVPAATRLGIISDANVPEEPVLYEISDAAFGQYLMYLAVPGASQTVVGTTTRYFIDKNTVDSVTTLNLSKTAAAITALETAGLSTAATPITNLDGIQFFTGLKSLTLTSNQLTSLDVSDLPLLEVLQMNFNFVTTLDVSHNPNLKKLRYQATAEATNAQKISSINISNNPLLYNINLRRQNLATFTLSASTHVNFTVTNLVEGDTAEEIAIDMRNNPGANFVIPASVYSQIQANSTAAAPLQGVTN
ncbi:Internalin-J precursor [compost metagenome]